MDALTTAYFANSPLGQKLLAEDLKRLEAEIAKVRRQLRKAKKKWCSMLTSKQRRKKFRRLQALYNSLRVYRRLVWSTKFGATHAAQKNMVLAHYAHAYKRDPDAHNQGGSLSTVLNKIAGLNALFGTQGGLELGADDIGRESLDQISVPASFRTVKALTDDGLDNVQFRFPPEAYLWNTRRSITKHPFFRFGKGGGERFYPPGKAVLAYALLVQAGVIT